MTRGSKMPQKLEVPVSLKWQGRPGLAFVPGWPTVAHEEPDEAVAQAKLASGLYLQAGRGEEIQDHAGEDQEPPAAPPGQGVETPGSEAPVAEDKPHGN